MDMRGRSYNKEAIQCFLLPIIKNKLVTEKELIMKFPNNKIGLARVDALYRHFVSIGFPIRRKIVVVANKSVGRKGNRQPNYRNRAIVYYLE